MEEFELLIEFGWVIMGFVGVVVYIVGVIKDVLGICIYVFVDGGMGDNIRLVLYGSVYVVVVVDCVVDLFILMVMISGKYCESGDVFVCDVKFVLVLVGDLIVIFVFGVYVLLMVSVYNVNGRFVMVM